MEIPPTQSPTRRPLIPAPKDQSALQAKHLLRKDEAAIPDNVLRVVEYCTAKGIGFALSRNEPAGNCRDARNKRHRLGHDGIALYDEMKSLVGVGKDLSGATQIIAMHCRGHMAVDLRRVNDLCHSEITLKSLEPGDKLWEGSNIGFGTVNPILLEVESKGAIVNIFDLGLLESMSRFPGTMMTNAGDLTWGFEFDPGELVAAIENKIVAHIAIPDTELKRHELPNVVNPKAIGIITGNGPDSGIALWEDINEYIVDLLGPHFLGDISLPRVSVVSVPAMGLSMELDRREQATWEALSEAVRHLKNERVELLALACHTTHYFTDRIRAIFDGDGQRFVSMAEVVMKYIEKNKITDLAILGINYVADLGQWSAYSGLSEYRVEQLSEETLKKFHDLGYAVKHMSERHKSFKRLIGLIKNDVKSSNVIIALTELSILLQSQGKKSRSGEKNIIDALELYARAIAKESLGISE